MMYNHPMTPIQASPGAGVHPHSGEDFEIGSPPWPRTPASPVFNSHPSPVTPQDSYRTTKVKVSVVINFKHLVHFSSYSYSILEI